MYDTRVNQMFSNILVVHAISSVYIILSKQFKKGGYPLCLEVSR